MQKGSIFSNTEQNVSNIVCLFNRIIGIINVFFFIYVLQEKRQISVWIQYSLRKRCMQLVLLAIS